MISWGEPVRYHIGGGATEADLQQIYSLIDALNSVPGFPGIRARRVREDASLTVSFVDTAGMDAAAGDSFNGYVTLRWALDGYGIVSGQIYYNTELDQGERNAVIVEELVPVPRPAQRHIRPPREHLLPVPHRHLLAHHPRLGRYTAAVQRRTHARHGRAGGPRRCRAAL